MEKIIFLGGDKRELTVMKRLRDAGYQVFSFGLPPAAMVRGVTPTDDPQKTLADCQACIMPLPPFRADGLLHTLSQEQVYLNDHTFDKSPTGMLILTGIITEHLRCIAPHCRLCGLLESDELALPLAEATAEGAIAEAIRLSDGLMAGEKVLVIGFGRIGSALTWRLEALGCEVTILNRGKERADLARDYGYHVEDWRQLGKLAAEARFIFNTAPALLLTRPILQWLQPDVLVVDLAATPGGTDFAAASELGLRTVLAGGLPGRYAPAFSGSVMADVYLQRLQAYFKEADV